MGTKFKGIKTAADHQRGELSKNILRLVGAGVVIGSAVVAPNALQLVDYFNPKGRAEKNRVWKALKYLEERGRVRFEETETATIVHLTTQGKVALTEIMVWELTITEPSRWDGKWRLVMFDFPIGQEKTRKLFRAKLEDFGFQMYQKSVFLYPHDCREEVSVLVRWCEAEDYVRFVVVEELHGMREYAKKFDLL